MQVDPNDTLLFTALAEQLKIPLLQIVRLSEITSGSSLPRISTISEQALRLVDAFVQSRDQQQMKLNVEPVNTSAVLYDVAQALYPLAKQFDFVVEIDQQGRSVPVMAHRQSLKTMLTLLGTSFIESGSEEENTTRHLILGTHRSARGTVVGAFSPQVKFSQNALEITRQLHGLATQSIPLLGQAGGAGLAIADKLSEQIHAPLRAYRHRSLIGIGSLLSSSHQLQLEY